MRNFLAAIAAGILFAFSLPPYNLALLGWLCFTPLLIAAIGRRSLEAMGLGMVAALSAGLVQVGWYPHARSLFFAYYPFLLLVPFLAVWAEVGSANRKRVQGMAWVLLMAAFGVCCEYLTRFLPMPIHIALSQYRQPIVLQVASITGVWGVSFLMWWTNAALADAFLSRTDGRCRPLPLAVGAALVACALIFGAVRLHGTPSTPSINVAAIQDYSGNETGDLAPPPKVDVDRVAMTRKAREGGAHFVVWSEECLGTAFDPSNGAGYVGVRHRHRAGPDPSISLARNLGIYVVAGYGGGEVPLPYNSAALITPDGRVAGIHHKIALYAEEKRKVRPGTVATAFPTDMGPVGMEICFDTCNTSVTRRIARAGARLIAVPTYDPPVVHGIMHNLHAALMPLRAVENGVPMVRADSNGTSEVIDANGRILAAGPLYSPSTVSASLPLGTGQGTVFTRLGDWFAYLCIGWFVIGLGVVRVLRSSPPR